MSWLFRILPYWKWILGVIGVAALGGSIMYAWQASVDREIAQRAYEQTRQQLEAVTRELEAEKNRRQEAEALIEKAAEEAAEIEDAQDPAPDSTRHLLNRLYNN